MNSALAQSDFQGKAFENVQQVLIIVAALCTITVSAWVLIQSPAQHYEVMYDAYPTVFWMLIATGLGASALVFLLSSLRGDGYWTISLAFVCVIYFLYSFLPLFRGWAMYGRGEADVLSHVGSTAEILQTTNLPGWNFYPGFHILLGEFDLVGFEIRSAHTLFTAVFMLIYVFGVFSLSRQLTGNKRIAVTTLFVAVIPLYERFHHTFHPAMFAFMMVPAYLFVFERYRTTEQWSYLVYAFLLSVVLVISHPVTSLYVIVMLVVAVTVQFLYKHVSESAFDRGSGIPIVAVMVLTWVIWFGQFEEVRRLLLIALGIEETEGPTGVEEYGTQELLLAPTIRDIVVPFVERYGPIFLIGGLASITAVIVFVRLWQRRTTSAEVWISSQYVVGAVIGLAGLLTFTAVLEFEPIRNARYAILMGTLLIGLLLSWLLSKERREVGGNRGAILLVVALLLLLFPLAVTHTYYPHMHLTYAEEDGTEWFYDHHTEESIAVSHHVTEKMRMYDRGGRYSDSLFEDIGDDSPMPQYLGYRSHDTIGQVVDGEQAYLVTKEYDTEFYKSLKYFLQEESIVYTKEEQRMLRTDQTADQVYGNGGYTVWLINGDRAVNETTNESNSNNISLSPAPGTQQ